MSPSSPHTQYYTANNIGRYTSYQYRIHENEKISGLEPYHPHYCRLLEFMCYVVEETSTGKLHGLVEEFERELLMPHYDHDNKTNATRIKK
mmetsp:Transcript_14889/g.32336  ORF Transcript_14889/g.32336 Transcript_14889/m.32336 type:complete len:91 (+) Transcript_14889:2302-2574(+)